MPHIHQWDNATAKELGIPAGAVSLTGENLESLMAQQSQHAAAKHAIQKEKGSEPSLAEDESDLTDSDVYGMSDFDTEPTVKKTFILDGKKKTVTFLTSGRTDAEVFTGLINAVQGRLPNGNLSPVQLKILPPVGEPFLLKDRVYLGELRLLALVCPALSVQAWAILGRKVGPKGKRPGEHGINDISAYALEVSGLLVPAQVKEEKDAGEDFGKGV